MDPENIPQPTVQIVRKGFFETTKGKTALATGLGIILFVILIIGLNYFDIISPFQLSFLPKKIVNLVGTPQKITLVENFGFKAGELTLNCPVESAFCTSQKLVNLNKKDTVFYKAASNSAVLTSIKPQGLENIAVLENKNAGKKYFYESVVSKDNTNCYTIAYTLPSDAIFKNILSLDFIKQNLPFATLGTGTFQIEGQEANVLIQVRNTPIDLGTPCSLIKKSPEFFKNF